MRLITMWEKQILAMDTGIQYFKKIGGNQTFFRDLEKMSYRIIVA